MAEDNAENKSANSGANTGGKADPSKKVVKKVISGEATARKKGVMATIAEYFSGDDFKTIAKGVLVEVVLPELKSLLFNATTQGLERRLWGRDARRGIPGNGYIPYNRIGGNVVQAVVNAKNATAAAQPAPAEKPAAAFDSVVVPSRADAQAVLDEMGNIIDQYGMVFLADFYDMVGYPTTHVDNKWGWYNMHGQSIRPVANGFLLVLPRPVPID